VCTKAGPSTQSKLSGRGMARTARRPLPPYRRELGAAMQNDGGAQQLMLAKRRLSATGTPQYLTTNAPERAYIRHVSEAHVRSHDGEFVPFPAYKCSVVGLHTCRRWNGGLKLRSDRAGYPTPIDVRAKSQRLASRRPLRGNSTRC
jgi:hypothetical protein